MTDRPLSIVALLMVAFAILWPTRSDADVLDVGDSHTYYTQQIWGYSQWPSWEVDARPGRASTEGVAVLRDKLRGRHGTVVFDVATNDGVYGTPEALRDNLKTVWNIIGSDRRLVLVTPSSACCPEFLTQTDSIVHWFASIHPNRTTLVEWYDEAVRHPEWCCMDYMHYNAEGYYHRLLMVKAAVQG